MPRLIFVYGTLKRGEANHLLMKNADFVSEAVTMPYWDLKAYDFPFLVPGMECVGGEIYSVPEWVLGSLDALEGHPDWYLRRPISLAKAISGPLEGVRAVEAYTYPKELDAPLWRSNRRGGALWWEGDHGG